MGYNEPDWGDCEAITAATAETVGAEGNSYLRITNGINDRVWIKFNWTTGDTEVSATNFDVVISAYGFFEFISRHNSAPTLRNARVLCATSGSVAFWGW